MLGFLRATFVLLVCVIGFLGCGSSSPKDVALSFVEEVYKEGDVKDALKYVELPEGEADRNFIEGKMQMAVAQVQKKAEKSGGIKNIEVANEEIKENTAKVKIKITYDNGKNDIENFTLNKVKNEWKIRMGKY